MSPNNVPTSRSLFSYFLPLLLCIVLFAVYGVVQNTFYSVRNKNEPSSRDKITAEANKNHFAGESNGLSRFNQWVATQPENKSQANTTSELTKIKEEIPSKDTISSSHTNKNERVITTTTKAENEKNTKETTTPSSKERNKKDSIRSSSSHTNKTPTDAVTNTTEKAPCCEQETIQNFQGAKASNKDLTEYSELLSKWASTLHKAREAVKKGGTKADTVKALLDSFIDGKISKNKYDDSIKKLEL